nr:hypothetical protein CFP56_04369 [Quercus suber]
MLFKHSPLHHIVRRPLTTTTARRLNQGPHPSTPSTVRPPPRNGRTDKLPVFPLVAIFCIGSVSFYYLAKTRQGSGTSHYVLPDRAPPKDQWPRTSSSSVKDQH